MIGLTEHWNASIRLFHAQYGGQVYPEEFQIIRSGVYQSNNVLYGEELLTPLTIFKRTFFHDEYDDELYSFARELFIKRLTQYNLSL